MITSNPTPDTAEIRRCIEARVRAVREKDIDGVLASYAPDVRTFDVVEPLANDGIAAVRKRLAEWFASFSTPIDYTVDAIELAASGDVAFDTHFTHVQGTGVNGTNVDMWFRETVGWRKIDGAWKVVHQHSSAPFDRKTFKARIDLQPPTS